MKDYPEIDWHEQCKFCTKGINTTYCDRNQVFMKKLESIENEGKGDIEFLCQYFALDKTKLIEENK